MNDLNHLFSSIFTREATTNNRTHEHENELAHGDFHAATVDELRKNTPLRRAMAIVDQRLLFAHRGRLELTPNRLTLGSWKSLTPDDVYNISIEFLPEYGRIAAGGARGGFPSLGVLERLGAPLVLDLKTGERVVLIIGYTWWSGSTKNTSWLPVLETFAKPKA